MGYTFVEITCKRCGKEAVHKVRRTCYYSKRNKSFGVKRESYHCLKCNKYWLRK